MNMALVGEEEETKDAHKVNERPDNWRDEEVDLVHD